MIKVGSIYQINNLYDVYNQLDCGEYPPKGFRSGDYVRIYAIYEESVSVTSYSIPSSSRTIRIPIEYIKDNEINLSVDIK